MKKYCNSSRVLERRLVGGVAKLWQRGDVEEFLFHEGQQFINQVYENSPGGLLVFNISRQWGKTFFSVVKAITTAIRQPGSRIRIGAAFESDLTEFIEPSFEAALATCPEALRPHYVQQKKRFLFPNGSTIKLVGLDKKPNGLRGNTIDLIILDEAGFIRRLNYLYDSVIVPLTTHRPNARILIQGTPPESPDHEFWDFVDRAKAQNTYAEFNIDKNPMLKPEDIERLEIKLGGRDTTAFRREYLCEKIIEAERAIIPEWKKEFEVEFDPNTDPQYQFWHKYQAMDIGVQVDKTICLFAYYNLRQATLYIMDEVDISGTKTTTDLIASKLLEKETEIGYENTYRRIADNSHPLLLNDLSSKSIHFAATDKAKLHEMVGELRVWVRSGRVKVHKRCKQMIGCLNSGIWNEKRDQFERSKVFGHYDALAALIYLIRNLDTWTNPVPAWFENPDRMPLPNYGQVKVLSPMGQDIKSLFRGLK